MKTVDTIENQKWAPRRLCLDTHSSYGGTDHRLGQNRTGRPNSTGRATGVSGLCATCALPLVSGDLLMPLTF